jgi:hypothetical protein
VGIDLVAVVEQAVVAGAAADAVVDVGVSSGLPGVQVVDVAVLVVAADETA